VKLLENLKPPEKTVEIPDWVGLGASAAQHSTQDENILNAENGAKPFDGYKRYPCAA
jgi:hypothetical protein